VTKIHETQSTESYKNEDSISINPFFEDAQRIEGGLPKKKVQWNTMPKPVRVIGKIFIGAFVVMSIVVIIVSFIK